MDAQHADRPLDPFSLLDTQLLSDPYPFYARMQEDAAVVRLNDDTGFTVVAGGVREGEPVTTPLRDRPSQRSTPAVWTVPGNLEMQVV